MSNFFFKGKDYKLKNVDDQVLIDYLKHSAGTLYKIGKEREYFLEMLFTDDNHIINSDGNVEFAITFDKRGFWLNLEMTPSETLLKVGDKKVIYGLALQRCFVTDWLNEHYGIFGI